MIGTVSPEVTQQARVEAFGRALVSLSDVFSASDVYGWVHANAPWVEDLWVEGRLAADTVNDRRRQHMPGPHDLLFERADGRYERYDPGVHGLWTTAGHPVEAGTRTASVTGLVVPTTSGRSGTRDRRHLRRRAG